MSITLSNKTIQLDQQPYYEEILAETAKTIDPSLHCQIKDKYKTFTNFNFRDSYREKRQNRKKKVEELKANDKNIAETLASFMLGSFMEPEEDKDKKKKKMTVEELPGVKSERR